MKQIFLGFFVSIILGGLLLWGGFRYLSNHNAEVNRINNMKRADISVTIIEGLRTEEIAQIMDSKGICDYEDFMKASANKSGYLFPDTYRFYPDSLATDVVSEMYNNFVKKTAGMGVSDKIITLASIVEREATSDLERPSIAGVYQNRLEINMKLDADPTVQYAKESGLGKSGKYWQKITQADYSGVISPYNTYLNKGLPPKPICNPGLKSIQAALDPEDNNYLYFLHKDGKLIMSKTLEEHESAQGN